MRGRVGRGWADARQTARHQAGCMGPASGREEPQNSAFGSHHRDAPPVLWLELGLVGSARNVVGSISSPRAGLCHHRVPLGRGIL